MKNISQQRNRKIIKTLDCTFRDGGYVNNWHFDKKIVRESYRSLSKAGVDIVELGYKNRVKPSSSSNYGIWNFCPPELIEETVKGVQGATIALMIDYDKVTLDDIEDRRKSPISLLRIATHKDKLRGASEFAEALKNKGYAVSLNLMGFTSYDKSERKEVINILKKKSIDYLYIADSYGSLLPNQIEGIFKPYKEELDIEMGFHPHNNLQMAFANTIEAIRCGIDIVDGSMYGIGRAAGNLQIEILIAYLELSTKGKYNVVPILNTIDRYFVELKKKHEWGYELPYMISGMLTCHPNYSKELVQRHEYAIEDVWDILKVIKKSKPIGFSKDKLDEVIKGGIFLKDIEEPKVESDISYKEKPHVVNAEITYKNRHAGRDFLVFANGPSLKEYKKQINAFIKKYDPVIIGSNFLGGLFTPHYHGFSNKRRFAEYVDTVDRKSKLLISQYISSDMIREYNRKDYEIIYYKNSESNFDILDDVIQSNCKTVSLLLIGLAIVMGAERIFIAGMDGYNISDQASGKISKSHFYKETDETTSPKVFKERYEASLKFLKQINEYMISKGKEGIHIITPTNYKPFYKGIKNYIEAA